MLLVCCHGDHDCRLLCLLLSIIVAACFSMLVVHCLLVVIAIAIVIVIVIVVVVVVAVVVVVFVCFVLCSFCGKPKRDEPQTRAQVQVLEQHALMVLDMHLRISAMTITTNNTQSKHNQQ